MTPLARIERLWSNQPGVTPLLSEESKRPGLCIETVESVAGLKALVEQDW